MIDARPYGALGAALMLALALVAPQGPGAAAQSRTACRDIVGRQLLEWDVREPARPQPPAVGGASVRHWPTGEMGTWVVEERSSTSTSLSRVTPTETTRIEWPASCVPAAATHPRAPAPGPRFSDDDLARRLREQPSGVVYLWSPHMPLSVDGLQHLRRAAAARALAVDVVLDPAADRSFAANIAAANGWPDDALRVADSVELMFRDVLVHAPTVLVYSAGRFPGSAYPGFHTELEYAQFLERTLSLLRR